MENQLIAEQTSAATLPIQDEKTIYLRKPVTFGGVTYEKLDLCEPTAEELAKSIKEPTSIDTAIALISMVAKVPRTVAAKLSQRDLKDAADFLAHFSDDSQEMPG